MEFCPELVPVLLRLAANQPVITCGYKPGHPGKHLWVGTPRLRDPGFPILCVEWSGAHDVTVREVGRPGA